MFDGLRAIRSAARAGDTNESTPVDSEYRTSLDTVGKAQYDALRRGERSRATRLRERVVEGPALGSGIGRDVYSVPEDVVIEPEYDSYIVKFATPDPRDTFGVSRDGRVQNRTEATIWKETRCDYLVPVTAAHPRGYWLLMPLAEHSQVDKEDVTSLTNRLATDCGLEQIGVDITEQDIFLLDGELKLCDYGFDPANQ